MIFLFSCKNKFAAVKQNTNNTFRITEKIIEDSTIIIGGFDINKLSNNPNYKWYPSLYSRYPIDSIALNSIENNYNNLQFTLFVGTWCSDSRSFLSKFMKIADHLNIPMNDIEVIGVNKRKSIPIDIIERYKITYVPTLIIQDSKKELNRIVEFTNKSIEEDISDIINRKKYIPFREEE